MTPTDAANDKNLPAKASDVAETWPEIWTAYAALGEACAKSGSLDNRTIRLVKLALSIGAASEGALHSHVRRALDEGVSEDELQHVALLAIPMLGLPRAVAALTWIEDITKGGAKRT